MTTSLLIANRGEITCRIIRTARATHPVVLNLFQDPCLDGGALLDGASFMQSVRHGPRIKSGVTVIGGGAGLEAANLSQAVRHGC